MTASLATSTASTTTATKKLTAGDKKEAKAKIARTMPWTDLPANPDLQREPRKDTTIECALLLLRERGKEGATLAEIQKSFDRINMGHHDAKALLRWMSDKRGFGFHMKKGTEQIVLVVKNDNK
jgi:hypothetical protein